VLIILDVGHGLGKVTVVRSDPRLVETVLDLAKELLDDGNSIFADDDAFELIGLYLIVPLVTSDFLDCEPLLRVGIKDLFD